MKKSLFISLAALVALALVGCASTPPLAGSAITINLPVYSAESPDAPDTSLNVEVVAQMRKQSSDSSKDTIVAEGKITNGILTLTIPDLDPKFFYPARYRIGTNPKLETTPPKARWAAFRILSKDGKFILADERDTTYFVYAETPFTVKADYTQGEKVIADLSVNSEWVVYRGPTNTEVTPNIITKYTVPIEKLKLFYVSR
jgi:hypothetical protein